MLLRDFGLYFCSATQFSQLSQFSQLVFRSVSPSFAKCVSQVLQIRVLQGFANTFFRSFTLVSQDSQGLANTSFAKLRNSQFRKNLQIGFSFSKFRKVFAMGILLMIPSASSSESLQGFKFKFSPRQQESGLRLLTSESPAATDKLRAWQSPNLSQYPTFGSVLQAS